MTMAMDPDEIVYNPFYHSLRNEFRKKYEFAISKCWTVCVPCGNSLRGLIITDNFVDNHILKPHMELQEHFISTGELNSSLYKLNGMTLELIENNENNDNNENKELLENNDRHKARVLSIERGYNKEFQMYLILVLDKPLLPEYSLAVDLADDEINLDVSITSYKEASNFLDQLSDRVKTPLKNLDLKLSKIELDNFNNCEELRTTLKDLTRHYWAIIMRKQTLYLQRDARFQKLLTTALEVYIMHCLHDKIYSFLSTELDQDDSIVNNKMIQLVDAGITPDQLGADESLAISLPAAVVELATLDAREGPLEKLLCLRSTLDLIVAEVKGALAEVQTKTEEIFKDNDNKVRLFPQFPSTNDLIPLLLYVIIKSRPKRLVTDLHYIKDFLWSVSPQDGMSYSLIMFQRAVGTLYRIDISDLPDRSHKVKTELPISELLDVMSNSEKNITPLDRQIHHLATMLEKCTQD